MYTAPSRKCSSQGNWIGNWHYQLYEIQGSEKYFIIHHKEKTGNQIQNLENPTHDYILLLPEGEKGIKKGNKGSYKLKEKHRANIKVLLDYDSSKKCKNACLTQTGKYGIGTRWDQENAVNFVRFNNSVEVIYFFKKKCPYLLEILMNR